MSLAAQERATYEEMWAVQHYYNDSPGQVYLPIFLDMAQPLKTHAILDAGCGAGAGALALVKAGFTNVRMCDITDAGLTNEARALRFTKACLWEDLSPQLGYMFGRTVDWVYCCDVLEHIPPTFTMLTVYQLLRVARRGVFLTISLDHDRMGAWVGKSLHQTVQSFPQWKEQLNTVGRVVEARDMLNAGAYLVVPK